MKKNIKTLIYLALALTLSSCTYYSSEIPISKIKESNIDSTYIGKWKMISEQDLVEFKISNINDSQYILAITEIETNCEKQEIKIDNDFLLAHNTQINNVEYFNIRKVDKNSKGYFIGKCIYEKDTLYIYGLDKDSFKLTFDKSKQFTKYIKNNQKEFDKKFKLLGKFIKSKGQFKIRDK